MKNLLFVLITVLSLVAASCSKSDDDSQPSDNNNVTFIKNKLSGIWQSTEYWNRQYGWVANYGKLDTLTFTAKQVTIISQYPRNIDTYPLTYDSNGNIIFDSLKYQLYIISDDKIELTGDDVGYYLWYHLERIK